MNDASAKPPREQITTKIWREEPEPDNPFAAALMGLKGKS